MSGCTKNGLTILTLLSLLTARSTLADSLATIDGNIIVGDVSKTATGYTVKTADGQVQVLAARVKKILYDHPQDAPPADQPGSLTPTAKPPANPLAPAMLTTLLKQGQAALASGEYDDARRVFTDALKLDPANPQAGKGLGFAWLKLNKPGRAEKPLELATANQRDPGRDLSMAWSEALLSTKNPGRAAKLLKTYLETHPEMLDEPVINGLGIALSQMDRSSKRGALYCDGTKLYKKLVSDLEAAQTGQKRWGVVWLPADEVTRRQQDWDKAQAAFDSASTKLQVTTIELKSAQDSLHSAALSSNRDAQVRQAQTRVNNANTAQQTAQRNYDTASSALAKLTPPDFPADIPLDSVDLTLGTPLVATAAPVEPPPPPAASAETPLPSPRPPAKPAADADPPPAPAQPAEDKPDPHATRYAAAFAIAPDVLVTAAAATQDATSIQVTTSDGKTFKATVLRAHQGDGIALLKVEDLKLPCLAIAGKFQPEEATSITCFSYPDVDLFNPLPKPITATAKTPAGNWTIRFDRCPRLPGGPLLCANAVVGVELADRDSELTEVPAATLKSLQSLVSDSAQVQNPATDPKAAVVQVTAEH